MGKVFGLTLPKWAMPQANPARVALMASEREGMQVLPQRDFYHMLKAYYLNNGLYAEIRRALLARSTTPNPAILGLKNPAHRAVEFYAGKLWPGYMRWDNAPDSAMQVVTEYPSLIPWVMETLKASGWNAKKQLAARWLPLYGDLFTKTRQSESGRRVFHQLIEPRFVTEFAEDERDNITMIRVDTPIDKVLKGLRYRTTHIEVWSEREGVRIWHDAGPTPGLIIDLGPPNEVYSLDDFGIDFVPFTHAKFQDIGEQRGIGCFVHAIDKIDEANAAATRLHQILYRHNKPLWALMANGVDATGRPLPAPKVGANAADPNDRTSEVTLTDDDMVTLAGTQQLTPLVANLDYQGALNVLLEAIHELERDLPEILYSRLLDLGANISGRAIRYTMQPAADRAIEARANGEQALIRSNQMALTIGMQAGVYPPNLGDFDAGTLEHSFAVRPVFVLDSLEEAQAELAEAQAVTARIGVGISPQQGLRELDYSDEQIETFAAEIAATPEGQARLVAIDRQRQALEFDRNEIDVSGVAGGEGPVTVVTQTGGGGSTTRP